MENKSEKNWNISKQDKNEFEPVHEKDISPEDALLYISRDEKLCNTIFSFSFCEEFCQSNNPKELLFGKFRRVYEEAVLSMEMTDEMEKLAEGPLREEIVGGISDLLQNSYDVMLDQKMPRDFRIIFLDKYRWPCFVKSRGSDVSRAHARTFPAEKLIAINSEKSWLDVWDKKEQPSLQEDSALITLIHELGHASSEINYWTAEDRTQEIKMARRVGIMGERLQRAKVTVGGGSTMEVFQSSDILNPLNEGIIQKITEEVLLTKFADKISDRAFREISDITYNLEREVLEILFKKVSDKLFVRATFEKSGLKYLAIKMKDAFGPRSLEVLGDLMEWEKVQGWYGVRGYKISKRFLEGKKIKIMETVFGRVNSEFIRKHYPNIELV